MTWRRRIPAGWLPLAWLLAALRFDLAAASESASAAARLWWYPDLKGWSRTSGDAPGQIRFESPPIVPAFAWNEAIVSWNSPTNVALEIRAWPDGAAHAYVMGQWCADTNAAPRSSVAGQNDAWGKVDTDTLVAHQPARLIRIDVRARRIDGGAVDAGLLRIGVSLVATGKPFAAPEPNRTAWGRHLGVPVRSQADFPEGVQSWCSPTSVTMLLEWWRLNGHRDIPAFDVDGTARGVFDPGWPGTGNWAFNTAFAGQQPGLAACVARFDGLPDVEDWIAAGQPVAASVSYALLKGAPASLPGDGHLVVVTGFTANGDVWINDPGVRRDRVARVVSREAFERAWAHSRRTVYLVWPTDAGKPAGGDGRW